MLETFQLYEEVCGSRPTNGQVRTKRRTKRRTQADIAELTSLHYSVVEEDLPMTVPPVV